MDSQCYNFASFIILLRIPEVPDTNLNPEALRKNPEYNLKEGAIVSFHILSTSFPNNPTIPRCVLCY
jgi:hypothetical protein